jgi:hypothetical protein
VGDQFPCHANNVSGMTTVVTSARIFRSNSLAFTGSRRRWSSLNRSDHPRVARAERGSPREGNQRYNDMELPLVHPARHGQQNETERIEYFGHYVTSLSPLKQLKN